MQKVDQILVDEFIFSYFIFFIISIFYLPKQLTEDLGPEAKCYRHSDCKQIEFAVNQGRGHQPTNVSYIFTNDTEGTYRE